MKHKKTKKKQPEKKKQKERGCRKNGHPDARGQSSKPAVGPKKGFENRLRKRGGVVAKHRTHNKTRRLTPGCVLKKKKKKE